MSRLVLSATFGLVLGLTAAAAVAQAPAAQGPRPGQGGGGGAAQAAPVITKDPMSAPAGTYKLDKAHSSVIARIGHGGGFSFSTVRFGVTDGTLAWDPAKLEASKLTVAVDMTPHYDPIVYGLDIKGANFLDIATFPSASFVSTAIRRTGPTTGVITGDLTFRGQTHPVTIDASLVGAGKTGRGVPTIGFTGVMHLKRSEFGFTFLAGGISENIDVVLDGEFGGTPPAA
ncbi:MAG TPA: YceI family protein [Caulobacteraceae bacterium]|jgi:polyisoprenoid-binding protein YceI|nr:YceI family protein [Caulobacteraceae bacterium]